MDYVYVYQSELYCEDCGQRLQDTLPQPGDFSEREITDSNEWPQGPQDEGPSDSISFCASGERCINRIDTELTGAVLRGAETRYIGALLTDELTSEGEESLREFYREKGKTPFQLKLAELYAEQFPDVPQTDPPVLCVETDGERLDYNSGFPESAMMEPGTEVSVRIVNPDAEEGYDQANGPLDWFNSARITADPEEDAIHFVLSIDHPCGGLCFTVRRIQSGEHAGCVMIHTPYPGEPMPHVDTAQKHEGTLIVVEKQGGTVPRRF